MSHRQRLVLVGAGHAHLETIVHIPELIRLGYDVEVISLRNYLYYSGMGPGLLEGRYSEDDVRFDVKTMVESRGGVFTAGRVTKIDAERRLIYLDDRPDIEFDVASFAVGSVIGVGGLDTNAGNVYTAKPVENLFLAGRRLERAENRGCEVVVSGGGASGVEIAANAAARGGSVTLITRGRILRRFPGRVRAKALELLKAQNVKVVEHAEVTGIKPDGLVLADGASLRYDMILLTTGTSPPELFSNSGIPTGPTGGMLVNEYLQSTKYPYLFGGGDCIDFAPRQLEKVGVFAVRENKILLDNLKNFKTAKSLRRFKPQTSYHLALNMGSQTGISYRRPLMINGSAALAIKERIDLNFMRRYQTQTTP